MLSLIEQLQHRHAEITAALRRIDEGTYGKCERCGRRDPHRAARGGRPRACACDAQALLSL